MHVQAHHQFYIAVTDCQPASPLLGDSQEISENQDTCSKNRTTKQRTDFVVIFAIKMGYLNLITTLAIKLRFDLSDN